MQEPQAQPVPQLPTREQLEAQVTQLVVTRSQLKDQIETIEKQLPSITSMLQLLIAQDAIAEAAANEEVIED